MNFLYCTMDTNIFSFLRPLAILRYIQKLTLSVASVLLLSIS